MSSTRLQPIGAPGDLISGVEFDNGQARQIGRKGQLKGGIVESVESGSPCDRAGIRPGDIILAINGDKVRDVIDYQFFCADQESLQIEVALREDPTNTRVLIALCADGESPGLAFTEPTFSPIRECNNHCPFCFIDQLPASMRSSLYIRDDDYRYSFLYGNFVTLTNLNERDWERLAEQRLSPLYVSVHATDLEMRRLLLGNNKVPDILSQLDRLASFGIRVHTQIVACPGMNDGGVLEQTVKGLASRFPNVLTIGVVPVGLTRTPQEILAGPDPSCSRILPSAADLPLRTFLCDEARQVVRQVRRWQRDFRSQYGCGLVYASDEFYLLGNEPVPSAAAYDGYPQYENGIGMVRDLLDDWKRLRKRLTASVHKSANDRCETASATLACGEMIADVLAPLVEEWRGLTAVDAGLAVIPNRFFGARVRVSGLLTGQDILANKDRFAGDIVILPSVMLDKTGSRLLDGMTPAQLRAAIGKPIYFAGYVSEAHRILTTTRPSQISA